MSSPSRHSYKTPSTERKSVLLANPRGFCAGVRRAIAAVEDALHVHGPPVYVRRAIVHNRRVVERLEKLGAVFVQDVSEIPEGSVTVLSAHGSAVAVKEAARCRKLRVVDAICPLVAKVHSEVVQWHLQGRHVVLVGHADHPEILGTIGQVPRAAISVVGDVADVDALTLPDDTPVAYAVQTTFSTGEADRMIQAIKARFSDCAGPRSSDICYATTNRQAAVAEIAEQCDVMLIVGDPMSSNARRLVETAIAAGCPRGLLVEGADDLARCFPAGAMMVGLSAAASAPDEVIEEVCAWLRQEGFSFSDMAGVEEAMRFRPVTVALPNREPSDLAVLLPDIRREVDEAIIEAIGNSPARSLRLADAMRYAATSGGKRFRAALTVTVTQILGGCRSTAIRAAAAIECVHAQSLVHDDLPCMDDDDLRRGMPTVHRRFDEATAVLAGDALLALAFEILADPRTHPDAAIRSRLVLCLARSVGQDGLAGGQMMDLYPSEDISRAELIACLAGKTGALVRYAVEAGILLGDTDDHCRARLLSFAEDLGLLFQLQDDLLDAAGDERVVGKALGKDAAKNRKNAVMVLGAEGAAQEAQRLLASCIKALEPFGDRAACLLELARFAARRTL
ncbi:MAG: 4-hydroxy-3-methylbut-2-enyl diphosphate reductase [Novosphingobium sp.]